MSETEEDNDYEAPEEFTSEKGIQQDEEMRKVQRENKGKERRRQWAQKKIPRPSQKDESIQDVIETETQDSQDNRGMLPSDIVELLAACEKHVFLSESEEEKTEKKPTSKKKRPKKPGLEPVILKDIPPAQCLQQNSLEFLKEKENASFKIICSFEQLQPSITLPFYIWLDE